MDSRHWNKCPTPLIHQYPNPSPSPPLTHIINSNLSPTLATLQSVFGYPEFRGLQAEIVSHVCDGNDALVLMPTGGGKSLCYQIPALLRHGVSIVISPLIALMQDQVDALRELGIKAAFLNSSLSSQEAFAVERLALASEVKLLYVAPERLLTGRFMALLDSLNAAQNLALFAIDEAHCVSQWGHDFRADYLQLAVLGERFPAVPRMALTATADALTRAEIKERLHLETAREFVASFDRPNIHYEIAERVDERKQLQAFLRAHEGEAGIIYCLSRKKVELIAEWLNDHGTPALPYHAGLDAATRRNHQAQFLRGEGVVMVATIAFGMGIDKPDVRFVVHLDLPKSVESYYQETGRAGRDGAAAQAWMLYGLKDVVQQRRFIDESEAVESFKRAARSKLDALLGLCETTLCRRSRLLAYFDEIKPADYRCMNCDNCTHPPQSWDGTEACRMALSAIYRTGQRYGAAYLIDLLRGKITAQTTERGHENLSIFGVGKAMDETTWRSVFRQIVTHGWVEIDVTAYGALQLTEAARSVLKGEVTALLRRETAAPASSRSSKGKGRNDDLPLSAQALFTALKAWRSDLAKSENVPAFVILHDSVLREIAIKAPENLAQLRGISGIGENKLARFGASIINTVADFAPQAGGVGINRNAEQQALDAGLSTTVAMSIGYRRAGVALTDIAKARELTLTTIYNHLALGIEKGLLSLNDVIELPPETLTRINDAFAQHPPATSGIALKPIFEALEGEFDYGVLRCVYAANQPR